MGRLEESQTPQALKAFSMMIKGLSYSYGIVMMPQGFEIPTKQRFGLSGKLRFFTASFSGKLIDEIFIRWVSTVARGSARNTTLSKNTKSMQNLRTWYFIKLCRNQLSGTPLTELGNVGSFMHLDLGPLCRR